MNPKRKLFLRKCQFPLTLVLGLYPLIMIINGAFVPSLVALCWIFPVFCAAWAILCMVLPGKYRYWAGLAGAVLLCLPVLFLPGPAVRWVALGEGVLYAVILMCCLPIAKWTEVDELPNGIMWLGMGLQLGAQVLQMLCKVYDMPQMAITTPWLTVSLLMYVLLAMLALNRRGLYTASTGRQAVPGAMRRKNTLFLLLFFGAAAILAALPAVGLLIEKTFSLLAGLIMLLILLTEPPTENVQGTRPSEAIKPTMMGSGTEDPGNPVLSLLFEILAYTALIAAVIGILYFLWRKSKKWLPRLWKRISNHFLSSTEDYVDEITSTREPGMAEKSKGKNGAKRVSRLRQRSLPPRQQIRSRYQSVLQKHPEWEAGSTAREKLPDSASSVYERARYSTHTVTEEDVRKFREDTKKM